MSDNETNPPTLLTFPCDFTIKVFGKNEDGFETNVLELVKKHIENTADIKIQSRPSENGKYTALNVSVHVDSKEQLDNIYRELSGSPLIIMTL